jgi:solute carrier family 45, member 1/2/4
MYAQNNHLTIWLAVLAIYSMDFAINAGSSSPSFGPMLRCPNSDAGIVQAVDRALLVDTLPVSDQARGNAWAAQMLGIGGVLGFFLSAHSDMIRLSVAD